MQVAVLQAISRGTVRGLSIPRDDRTEEPTMNTHTMKALSASALAALVLIWDEAPIADSPSWHVASAESEDRPLPNVNAGPTTKQRSDAVVRGDRRAVRPAAHPAK